MVSWVRDKGHLVDVHPTFERGDAMALARDAATRGADVVAVAGGDGTVNEVVNGLDGFETALGVLPFGTANDFARQAGIPADADHAMDVILRRAPVRMDTASLNGRRFLNVSTGGVGAEATAETPAEAKEQFGPVAYAISGVRKLADLEAIDACIRGPGFSFDGEILLFAAGVARVTGGGTKLTPYASVSDGLLDLCFVESMSRRDFAGMVLKLKRGEHIGEPGVHYAQLPWVTIDAERSVSVNVDGELTEQRRIEYRARRQDLWVHVAHLPGEEGGAA